MSWTIRLGILLSSFCLGTTLAAGAKHEIICEGWQGYNDHNHTMRMNCSEGQVILFKKANYGRTKLHKEVCETQRTDCDYSASTTPVVKAACDGQVKCAVNASNEVFTNQCALTYKYLEIRYKCVTSGDTGGNEQEKTTIVCEKADDINPDNFTAMPSCESENNKVVLITWANWGRLVKYEMVCPATPEITNCERDAIPYLQDICGVSQKCEVNATNENFGGDPCPNTYKYLEVEYDCVEPKKDYICEGWDGYNESNSTLAISCDDDEQPAYVWANYGRLKLHEDVCETQRTNCDYSNVTIPVVAETCDGKKSCALNASNDVFGNTCRLTYKYLEIIYGCVPENMQDEAPATNISVIKCEKSDTVNPNDYTAELSCNGPNEVIKTVWANWGRLVDYKLRCAADPEVTNCIRSNTTAYLQDFCGDKSTCNVPARNEHFGGDPCPNTYKYLEVHYICRKRLAGISGATPVALPVVALLISAVFMFLM